MLACIDAYVRHGIGHIEEDPLPRRECSLLKKGMHLSLCEVSFFNCGYIVESGVDLQCSNARKKRRQ